MKRHVLTVATVALLCCAGRAWGLASDLDTTFNSSGTWTFDFGASSWDQCWSVALTATTNKIVLAGITDSGGSGYDFGVVRLNSDGSFDTSFNSTGTQIIDFGGTDDGCYSVVATTTDGLVLAGSSNVSSSYEFAVARLNPDGSLDTSFDGTGMQTFGFGGTGATCTSMRLTPTEGIVLCGYSVNGNRSFAVARLNPDGSADASFNGSGQLVFDFGGTVDACDACALTSDGRIVMAGSSNVNGPDDFAVARLNEDGSLDSTFNGTGKILIDFTGGSGDNCFALALTNAGKIVAAGSSDGAFAVARLRPDGSLDTTFNTTGKQTIAVGEGGAGCVYSVAVQQNGKIMLAGFALELDNNQYFAAARLNADGSPDTTFNGGQCWKVYPIVVPAPGIERCRGMQLQADGKIVMGGFSSDTFTDDFAAVRLLGDAIPSPTLPVSPAPAALDTTFNTTGKQTVDVGGPIDKCYSLALTTDEKIVLAGYTDEAGDNNFAVARLTSPGALDTTFNTTGIQTIGFGTGTNDICRSVVLTSADAAVLAGYSDVNGTYDFAVARVTSAGELDTSFNTTGMQTVSFFESDEYCCSVALTSTEGIVLAGYSNTAGIIRFGAVLVDPDGTVGTNLFFNFGHETSDYCYSVTVMATDGVVMAGYSNVLGRNNFAVARLTPDDLSLDTSFNTTGMQTVAFSPFSSDYCYSVALTAGGGILLAGVSDVGGYNTFAIAKLNSSGSLDTSFNGTGTQTIAVGRASNSGAYSIAIQPDGKIVLTGYATEIDGNNYFAVARLNANGSPDTTFNSTHSQCWAVFPIVASAAGTGDDHSWDVALQTNKRIVLAGYTGTSGVYDFAAARLLGGQLGTSCCQNFWNLYNAWTAS